MWTLIRMSSPSLHHYVPRTRGFIDFSSKLPNFFLSIKFHLGTMRLKRRVMHCENTLWDILPNWWNQVLAKVKFEQLNLAALKSKDLLLGKASTRRYWLYENLTNEAKSCLFFLGRGNWCDICLNHLFIFLSHFQHKKLNRWEKLT